MIGKTTILLSCVAALTVLGDSDALYKKGAAVFKSDPVQALELFERAAGEGNVSAIVGAGHCYETGTGTKADYTKAIVFYEQAVKQNSLKACEGLGRIYASCPDPEFHDGAKAVKFAGAVARKKPRDYAALTLLAKAQARNMDFPEAGKSLIKAKRVAGLDELPELKQLQQNFEKGIPEPALGSEVWMMQASDSGASGWAILRVAGWCIDEKHAMYNPEQARMWYQRAAGLGSPDGLLEYGICCMEGIGGPVEMDAAIASFEKAFAGGRDEACVHLGQIYLTDKRDLDKVYKYYNQLGDTQGQTIELVTLILKSDPRRNRIEGAKPDELFKYGDSYSIPHTYTTYDIYGNSTGTSTTPARHDYALVYYLVAAESGHVPSMYKVASIYKYGVGTVSADPRRAERWLKRLQEITGRAVTVASPGSPVSRTSRRSSGPTAADIAKEAEKYLKGKDGVEKDPQKGYDMLMKAFNEKPQGYLAYQIGRLHLHNPAFKDLVKAEEWMLKAADLKYGYGCNAISMYYSSNKTETLRNGKKAVMFALRALEAGGERYYVLDTAACAYARDGQFHKAVGMQQKALGLAKKAGVSQEALDGYSFRLALFKQGQAWVHGMKKN